jgi:lysophospholipase L1-like esterase
VAAPVTLRAQDTDATIVAFGDSITEGRSPFDEQNRGGYPGRLGPRLSQGGLEAEVLNRGNGGESTAEGLSRIGGAIVGADIVLLMEGSNDIDRVIEGQISFESIKANLNAMVGQIRNAGAEAVIATVIPRGPNARRDRSSLLTFALVRDIRELAFQRRIDLVDPWEGFSTFPEPYASLYFRGDDPVGHPNAAGFELLAQTFADVLLGLDTMTPVIGRYTPNPLAVPEVRPGQRFELEVYDFGTGIARDSLTLTINDVPVEARVTGNDRRRILTHDSDGETVTCYARVAVQALDLAEPANRLDAVVGEHTVRGETSRRTDLNRDCRVDGRDIAVLARLFGQRSNQFAYEEAVDLVRDGVIDGADLAQVAADFGKTTF